MFSQRSTGGHGGAIAGLLFGAMTAVFLAGPARWAVSAGASVLVAATIVWFLPAIAAVAACRLWSGVPQPRTEYARLLAVSAWLAPVALLATDNSPLAAAAVVGGVVAAEQLKSRRDETPSQGESRKLFARIPPPRPGAARYRMQAASVLAYAACISLLSERPLLSLPFAFAAAAVSCWPSTPSPSRPARSRSAMLTALAACLTLVSLLPERHGLGFSGKRAEAAEAEGPDSSPGQYTSVILTTAPAEADREPVQIPAFGLGRPKQSKRIIPFSGEYWFFHWPRHGPGENATIRAGDPKESAFRSTDSAPILMQARQPLTPPLELSCCSAINVVLKGRERRPDLVAVELILALTHFGEQSLGAQLPVSGKSDARGDSRLEARYVLPPRLRRKAADRLVVRFHLDESRKASSAKMSIERFELIP